MKSYFAKLADRATLPNVPAASTVQVRKLSDPFESQEPTETQPPSLVKNKRGLQEHVEQAVLKPPQRRETTTELVPVIEQPKQAIREEQNRTLNPEPESTRPAQKTEPIINNTVKETEKVEAKARLLPNDAATPEVIDLTPPQVQSHLLPEQQKQTEDPTEEDQSLEERIWELEEQSVLLRKADAFMSSLLEPRRQPPSSPDKAIVNETMPESFVPREAEPNRIEPTLREPKSTTPTPEGPSLVIGSLIVEVSAPAPAPAPAQTPRVIVRGSPGRRAGLISSRRFGLGQF